MSKEVYNEGDLVEAVKGESVIRGRVELSPTLSEPLLPLLGVQPDKTAHLSYYALDGWAITVIEKAKPQLPTEIGCYESADFPLATGHEPYRLSRGGDWWLGSSTVTERYMADRLPLTRLAPVTEVLDKVRAIFGGPEALLHKDVDAIAAEYGVTK